MRVQGLASVFTLSAAAAAAHIHQCIEVYTVPEALAVLDGGQQLQPCTLVYAEQKLLSSVRAQSGFLCCRYAFHDDKLPRWFAEDESRHMRPLPQVCVCVGGGGSK